MKGVKKGRKSGGGIVLGKKYLNKLVKPKITANFVCLEISKDVYFDCNRKQLYYLADTFGGQQEDIESESNKTLQRDLDQKREE